MLREATIVAEDWYPKSIEDLGTYGGWTGCFGWINGVLYLGDVHHAQIIAGLIDNNIYTWETLMAAKQMWGWYDIGIPSTYNPATGEYTPTGNPAGDVRFQTDDAKQTYGVKTQIKDSFKEAYPWVKSWSFQKGLGGTTQQNYGQRARNQYLESNNPEDF